MIAVAKHDMGKKYGLSTGIVTNNVRYCADDPACKKMAEENGEDERDYYCSRR